MENPETLACRSVFTLHRWIETVFTRPRDEAETALTRLLESFHPDFAMVTPAGDTLTLAAVKQLFMENGGRRPGLRIDVDACSALASAGNRVTCRYRETHHIDGVPRARWSVAVIDIEGETARWRFLQETAIV